MPDHQHPLFTRAYRMIANIGEHTPVGDARTEVLSATWGRLLVVGLGPGHDLHHLPAAVTSVVAVEPSDSMRRAATGQIAALEKRGVTVDLIDAVGESLPLPDASVDSVLLAFVLCSVDVPDQVIREVTRVARPGAPVAVLEHVRAPDGTVSRRIQRLVGPVWPRVAGGCHVDRDAHALFAAAGYDADALATADISAVPPVSPIVGGVVITPS